MRLGPGSDYINGPIYERFSVIPIDRGAGRLQYHSKCHRGIEGHWSAHSLIDYRRRSELANPSNGRNS